MTGTPTWSVYLHSTSAYPSGKNAFSKTVRDEKVGQRRGIHERATDLEAGRRVEHKARRGLEQRPYLGVFHLGSVGRQLEQAIDESLSPRAHRPS